MFTPSNFSTGTQFKVKGDGSTWEVLSINGEKIIAVNKQNGFQGPIPVGNVTEILNVAKAEIKNEDIKILGTKPKTRGRKRKN